MPANRIEDDLVRVMLVALRSLEASVPAEGTLKDSSLYSTYAEYLDDSGLDDLPGSVVGLQGDLINQGYVGLTFSQSPKSGESLEQWLSRVDTA